MNERRESKTKTVTGISILRKLWLYVLGIFVVIMVIGVCVVSAIRQRQEEPILLPPQEIAVKSEMCFLTERFEEGLSFYAAGWPGKDKDKAIEAMKILIGVEGINRDLIITDVWRGTFHRIKINPWRECPSCQGNYEFLDMRIG